MRIERLTPAHAAAYRAVMLRAYADRANAFQATVPEREVLPLNWWVSRVSDEPDPTERVVGALVGNRIVGVAGLRLERRERTKHKATLFGMYVLPEHRGRGIARALVEAVLWQARSAPGTEVVQLTVMASNAVALGLYLSLGFESFGTEPLAVRFGARRVPLVHMWRAVDQRAGST